MAFANAKKKKQRGRLRSYRDATDTPTLDHIADICSGRTKSGAPLPVTDAAIPADLEVHMVSLLSIVENSQKHQRIHSTAETLALAKSIEEIGLQHPIGLTWEMRLIHGKGRCLAYEHLGRDTIPAVFHSLSELAAEQAEIDENLCRVELTYMERSALTARSQKIYEALHPETKRGAKGGRKSASDGKELETLSVSNSGPKSFVEETAQKTGKSKSTIREQAKVGRDFPDAIVAQIAGVRTVSDSKKELGKLARLAKSDPEQARIVAGMLKRGEVKTVTEALQEASPPADPEPPRDAPAAGSALRDMVEIAFERWRGSWGADATNVLAACILEEFAGELRDG